MKYLNFIITPLRWTWNMTMRLCGIDMLNEYFHNKKQRELYAIAISYEKATGKPIYETHPEFRNTYPEPQSGEGS